MHKSLKKLWIYQNQSLKQKKSAKKSFFHWFVLDLHIFLVHQFLPKMLFLRSCASLVLINKKSTVETCNKKMHLHIIFTVNSSQMNNEAAILKIRICLFFWFAVYIFVTPLVFIKSKITILDNTEELKFYLLE